MRRLFALTILIAPILNLRLRADAPDDQYVQVYHLIQEADDLKASGQSDLAKSRYLEAQALLKKLQTIYPDWNRKVIEYRLSYIEGKLDAAKALPEPGATQAPAGAAGPRTGPPPRTTPRVAVPPPAVEKPAEPSLPPASQLQTALQEKQNEITGLQNMISRLEADRNILQAKLKEALAAQPAAVDPKELARAEDQIRALQKEKDLLQVALDQEKNKKPSGPAPEMLDLQKKVQVQGESIAALTQEKTLLQGRLEAAARTSAELAALRSQFEALNQKSAQSVPETSAKVAELERKIASLNESITTLSTEKRQLEARFQTSAGEAAQLKALQNEVETLRKQAKAPAPAAPPRVDDGNVKKLAALETEKNALLKQNQELQNRLQSSAGESAQVKALQTEVQTLRAQMSGNAVKKAPEPKPESPKKIASLESSLKKVEAENASLQKQNKDLENRIKAAAKPASESARVKQLEKEREELMKKINESARAKYEKKKGGKAEDSITDIAALRARIGVLEADKAPYTAEELALFKTNSFAPKPEVVALANPSTPEKTAPAATAAPAEPRRSSKTPPPGAGFLLAQAQQAVAARRWEDAAAKYQEVLKLDEKNTGTLNSLGAVEMYAGKLDQAEKHIQAALAVEPEDARTLGLLGIVKFQQGKFDEALDVLSRSAQIDPKNPETQNYLGTTLAQKGQRKPAEAAFRKAIQLDPSYANAHANLAVFYATQQPPFMELAKFHYQKALSNGHPADPEIEKLLQKK